MKRTLSFIAASIMILLNVAAQVKDDGIFSMEEIKKIISAPEYLSDSLFDKINSLEYIIESPTLRSIGKEYLPSSLWGIVAGKDGNYHRLKNSDIENIDNVERCWIGCRDSIANDKWKKKLQKKYGTITTEEGLVVVPATWVTDSIYYSKYPVCHNGLWTATSYPGCYVENGSASYIDETFPLSAAQKGTYTLRDAVMDLREDLFTVLDGNGRQAREAQKLELTLLAYEIYRIDTLSARKYEPEDKPLLIHVHMAPGGGLQCDILNSDELSAVQLSRDIWLQSAFRQIKNIYIRPRRTLYGKILPGMVLKAKRSMTYWVFEEL